MTESDNGNGRVTMALLGAKVDALTSAVEALREENRRYHESQEQRVRDLERGSTKREQQIETMKADVDALEGKVNAWNWLNSIGAAAAAILAGIGWGR